MTYIKKAYVIDYIEKYVIPGGYIILNVSDPKVGSNKILPFLYLRVGEYHHSHQ
jgi:hypothetical protein